MPADLARDTAVAPLDGAPGWFAAELSDAWSYRAPSGGVLVTIALRAIDAAIADPSLRPISATALFCAPVPAGPIAVRVEVLRRGNATAQARASAACATKPGPGLEVVATFARDREGIDMIDARFPDVPAPHDAPLVDYASRGSHGAPYTFMTNFESRLALGGRLWEADWQPGPARVARWMRYLVPQRLPCGTVDPFALPPIADTMPPAIVQKLGPGAPRFHAPSLDLTIHFLEPARTDWLLVSAFARRARAGYATAEAEIWSEDRRLVAYATQTMMLRRRRT